MRKVWLAAALAFIPRAAFAQFCSNCILNSAAPQVAQFNVSSATVRGILTVGTLNTSALTVSGTMTAATFSGSGASLTSLNASALASGTVPSARVAGAYTGITSVGTIAAGAWQGTAVAPAYGGTGADLSISGTAGGLPYFTGSGVQGVVVSPGGPRVLMTAGSGAKPVWTSSPTLTGQNFSAIPLTALANGTLQAGVQVPNASLVAIDAAKVSGNIAGGAAFLTIALPVSNLAGGTLPTSNAASSVTVSGVPPGTFGGPTTLAQFRVGTDGRLYDAKQFNLVIYSTQVISGPLPPGVTIAAGQVSSGTLASNVVASSVAATGIVPGNYGSAARTITLTVGVDGRLSAIAQPLIALPLAQLDSGTLPGNVLVPAANIQDGTLGSGVVAQTLSNNGVTAGTYGTYGFLPQLTVSADGRVASATQIPMPSLSTHTAVNNADNNWTHAQTSQSSWTMTALGVSGAITAGSLSGTGSNITFLTPANFLSGSLPSNVIASSVAARAVGDQQLTTTGVGAGSYGSAAKTVTLVIDAQGRITSAAQQTVAISTGEFIGIVQPLHGGTGNDWSAIGSGGIPYFSGTGVLSVLAKSVNGYSLTQSAGIPAWAAAVSSATNVAGGAAGSLHYQSAANTTAMLAAGTNGYSLTMAAGLPAWASAVSSATNLAGGLLGSIPYQTAANTSGFLAAGTGVLVESGGAPSFTTTPTLTGTNFSAIPLSALNTGGLPVTITVTTGNFTGGFNGASQLVQLTAGGILPVLSGANLTSLTAANISAGTLGPAVIASSVAATGVTAASYGTATAAPSFTVGVDGRLTAAGSNTITPAASSITAGTLPSNVIASSVAATAVTAGSYGSATQVPTFTVAGDGRLTAASNTSIQITESQVTNLTTDLAAKASTGTNADIRALNALQSIGNPWTSTSSGTVNAPLGVGAIGLSGGELVAQSTTSTSAAPIIRALNQSGSEVFAVTQAGNLSLTGTATAGIFSGSGASLTSVPATSISAGSMGSGVVCSTAATSTLPLGNAGAQISAAYTTKIGDANTSLVHASADTTARTWTLDSYANVAYSTGTTITIENLPSAGTLTLSLSSGQSFCWMGSSPGCSTTSRTLTAGGVATMHSVSSTTWVLMGNGNLQ